MTAEHVQIQAFLAQHALEYDDLPTMKKAGIVPFLPGESLRYCVMTPVGNKPELGAPDFQLCKGTRMYRHENGWRDMRGTIPENVELEPLAVTALREGMEELGLKLSNIERLSVLGEYRFISATNRFEMAMWMLAAKMKNAEDFLPLQDIAKNTATREWLTLAEFEEQGRPDHAHILGQMEKAILACV